MSEWFKVQPWKGCVREIAPRVRIPLSAPIKEKTALLLIFKTSLKNIAFTLVFSFTATTRKSHFVGDFVAT